MDSSESDVGQVDSGKMSDDDGLESEQPTLEQKGLDKLATFRNLPLGPETLGTVRQLMADSKALLLKRKKLKGSSPFSPSPSEQPESISFSCRDEQVGFGNVPYRRAHVSSVGGANANKRRLSSNSNKVPSAGGAGTMISEEYESRNDRAYWYFITACSIVAVLTAWPSFPNLIAGFLWACLLNVYLTMDRTVQPKPESIGAPSDGNALSGIHASREKPVFKGWLNRLDVFYDPSTYHVRETNSVFAVLHGSILRLLVPKGKVLKHSSCFETISAPTFVSQRVFDLRGAAVVLRPQRLARRRWWSRKYPICIQLDPSHNLPAEMKAGRKFSFSGETRKREEAPKGDRVLSRSQSLLDIEKAAATYEMPKRESAQELLIFARTTREKEQWFFRLLAATGSSNNAPATSSNGSANDAEFGRTAVTVSPQCLFLQTVLSNFETYQLGLVNDPEPLKDTVSMNLIDKMHKKDSAPPPLDESVLDKQISWINAIISRTFFDFTTDLKWIRHVEWKIQRKLATLRLPWFLDELKLVALRPGSKSPSIRYIYEPTLDSWGLWVDFDIDYSGGFSLELETKINLRKLKDNAGTRSSSSDSKRTNYSDEEIPESPESSDDDDASTSSKKRKTHEKSPKSPWNIKRLVDKVSQTKRFQEATDYKFVKKIIDGVSETPLVLAVEVPRLNGRFAVNFPPPPSNRIWYGFRSRPKASFKAVPKVGTLKVSISHVTDWIEKKLKYVMDKGLVIPNMDDFIIPYRSFDMMYTRYNM